MIEVATIHQPPNTLTFDLLKCQSSLNVAGHPSILSNFAPRGNNLSAIASILSNVCGLIGMSASPCSSAFTSVSATPQKLQPTAVTPPLLPVHNTPTLLTHFLCDCEDELGISNVTLYESPLCRKSYGPNILYRVRDTALENIGIPSRDVIHLKDASLPWYTGPLVKCRRIETEEPSVEPTSQTVVSYKKRWYDADSEQTSASCFWGPPMTGGDSEL